MNAATGTAAGAGLAAALACAVIAWPAFGQVYKCKGADGAPVFQAAPCDDTSGKLRVPDKSAEKSKASEKAAVAESTRKSMEEAYKSRMDKHDYEGALAFATTDGQKSAARKKIADKDVKCVGLAMKVKEAQAKFDQNSARAKSDLDKAENNFRLSCR